MIMCIRAHKKDTCDNVHQSTKEDTCGNVQQRWTKQVRLLSILNGYLFFNVTVDFTSMLISTLTLADSSKLSTVKVRKTHNRNLLWANILRHY